MGAGAIIGAGAAVGAASITAGVTVSEGDKSRAVSQSAQMMEQFNNCDWMPTGV